MGNTDSKAGFRKAIQDLKNKDKIIEPDNDAFWRQFWSAEQMNFQLTAADVFSLVTAEDIRSLREDVPQNLATLAFKAIDHLRVATEGAAPCTTPAQQQTVLNCVRLLTRLVPFFLEEPEWRSFFWSALPSASAASSSTRQGPLSRFPSYPAGGSLDYPEPPTPPSSAGARFRLFDGPVLATTLINSLSTLLFCPGFTVNQHKKPSEQTEDLTSLDCVEYIWAAGVGFAVSPPQNANYDAARIEILRLLLACFSESMYGTSASEGLVCPNRWLEYFTSAENRPVLPLFTSLLNVVFSYDPVGYGVPYNYLMFGDSKEPLAEVALQVLIVCLDHVCRVKVTEAITKEQLAMESDPDSDMLKNMFINYLSRIHRDEDLAFMADGMVRLLNNPLQVGYLPSSTKKIHFQAELLILFWKCCEYNRKFLYHVLKSCVVLDILIPILHTLHQNRLNPSKIGLIHLNVFILLLLSGERNFGVRLNKPFTGRALPDLPAFTGNYADLIILVFHRMVTSGQSKLQPLFDCLLTIIQNISPYVKSLASVTATKLLHLFEAFSTPWFLYANPSNHNLVFYLMDTFNNLIQYQFDGNAPLVYCIIRKRALFHQLANLPMDPAFIEKTVRNRKGSRRTSVGSAIETESETTEETRRLEEADGEEKKSRACTQPCLKFPEWVR
ncbi:protein HID1-like [Paramacrobiotus metropolitanus]|uniref:protein HID1-like n=1 Tax=Paramacrobiotus metropolitanus TaxID=2943436 RepID=UPI002445A30F|nr:protein HID1-like [Paramacrobiotus metropolitanus]